MPPLPPADQVLPVLKQAVLPAAGGAAFVCLLFLCLGRWAAALGAAAGVVVGFVWANYTFEKLDWAGTGRLVPWRPWDDVPPNQTAWRGLATAGLLLVLAGLVSRWVGLLVGRITSDRYWWVVSLVVWLPRAVAVGVASGWLVPKSAADLPWVPYALPALMLLSWAAWDGLARSTPGGEAAAYQAAACTAAGAVLLYDSWASAMELAVVVGSALAGVAIVARVARADCSGAVPAGVAALPVLMLAGRLGIDEPKLPVACYWLVALAPLALLPFLVPKLSRQTGWLTRVGRAALVLAPLAVAVVLAAQFGELPFGGDEAADPTPAGGTTEG
ncbi:MAG: hypothetical protein K2X82_14080 [Gemmataceae bacterium]|nr:hypothetical protein [Gemmataceae bacterium]